MQPHGQFDMERRGQMLICRPSGPFNLASAMAYEACFRHELAGLMDRPWGIVEVATEFKAAWPEVLARFRGQLLSLCLDVPIKLSRRLLYKSSADSSAI